MKHLMTLLALLVSTAAVAQIPTLPWNPDGNNDQFIGLPDLLDLLTVYGQEFENAIVAEDGESAIMYMGDMGYPQCEYACDNLPGFWTMPNLKDLVPVWSDVSANGANNTWLQSDWNSLLTNTQNTFNIRFPYYRGYLGQSDYGQVLITQGSFSEFQCYCTAKQLPRVEYDQCITDAGYGSFYQALAFIEVEHNECVNSKLAEGWQLMGKTTVDHTGSDVFLIQSLWRFAQ